MQRTTRQAAQQLSALMHYPITARRLTLLIERGEIPPPSRITATMFGWTDEDIERARKALVQRDGAHFAGTR